MYVDIDQIDCWQQNQFRLEFFPLTCGNRHLHAKRSSPGRDMAANKAAAANDAEFFHVITEF